jgi:hypothetical protein
MSTIAPAGDDVIVPFSEGLAAQMSDVISALRKLEMERHLPVQKFLAEQGEDSSAFAPPGVRIDDNFDLSRNFFQQSSLSPEGPTRFFPEPYSPIKFSSL